MSTATSSNMDQEFLREYNSEASIRRYTKETAGNGISYLLDHDYGQLYLQVIEEYIPKEKLKGGIRLLEFGCGGGMNLQHLIAVMERRGIKLDCAYGTDFSETLIEAANRDAHKYLTPGQNEKLRFCVARNESLIEDMEKNLGISKNALLGSFNFILGVNTIRYCHRLKNENECVSRISDLLADGGLCVVIDMNNSFPAFRSRFRDRLTRDKQSCYLPTLEEYVQPFSARGLEIILRKNFCWVPHSAGPGLTAVMRTLTPILNTLVPAHAMRSLVISRKISHNS